MVLRWVGRRAGCALCAAWCAACFMGMDANAGVRLITHENVYRSDVTVQRTGQMLMTADRLLVRVGEVTVSDITESFIYRADLETLWKLDHEARYYIEINRNTLVELTRHMRAARRRMEAALEHMDDEQREALEGMMRDRAPDIDRERTRRVRRTDEWKTINGHRCVRYEVIADDTVLRELWVTPWDELGMEADEFRVLKKMADFQKEMARAVEEGPLAQRVEEEIFTDFEAVDGFPILVRYYENDEAVRDVTFLSIEREEMDPARFTVPEGYVRQDPFRPDRLPPPRSVKPVLEGIE